MQDLKRDWLTEAQKQLTEQGWCVVENVLNPAQFEEGLERLWDAAANNEARGRATFRPDIDANDRNVRLFNLIDDDALFRDLVRHPTALALVRSVLGDDFIISAFTANIARPGAKSMMIHSDQSLVMPTPWDRPWALNIIWALTDAKGENGSTLYLPGSHKFLDRTELPDDPIRHMIPFEAPAGSIIAMEGRMWHTSGSNVTVDEDRAMLFAYYTAAFLRSQANHNVMLSAETKAVLDEDMRRWLGLEAEGNVYGAKPSRHFMTKQSII